VCWLYPGNEMLEPLQDTVSMIENENPALIIEVLNIIEREYEGLDKSVKDRIESLKQKYDI
jgi:hypothetical protein